MSMRISVLNGIPICLFLSLLMGCTDRPPSRQELFGKYEYRQDNFTDKAQGTTCFTLNDDGTFVAGDTDFSKADGPKLPKTGRWTFIGGTRATIDLEHAGFPVRRYRSSIRALVNDDLGYYCELTK